MNRQNISSGAPWEDNAGYSRAVKIGNVIEVSGTVSLKDGKVFGKGNPYQQTHRIFEIIEASLETCGASLKDIVRTRMYVVNIDDWPEVVKAHGELFGQIRPATSLLGISNLIEPDFLVEIEVTAVMGN